MSLWDNVKKFAQPYADDDYDDYDEDDDYADEYEEPAETPARRSPRRAPAPAPAAEEEADEQDDYGFTPAPAASAAVSAGFNGQVLSMNKQRRRRKIVRFSRAAILLGVGRAIGETMAVIMVAGNQPLIPTSLLKGVRTLTTNVVLEMGYAADLHRFHFYPMHFRIFP